jgi:hypothetical protein
MGLRAPHVSPKKQEWTHSSHVCQEMGVETGIDLDAMIAAGQLPEKVVGRARARAVTTA